MLDKLYNNGHDVLEINEDSPVSVVLHAPSFTRKPSQNLSQVQAGRNHQFRNMVKILEMFGSAACYACNNFKHEQ